jgi:DNA mismatch repair ATPase MutL
VSQPEFLIFVNGRNVHHPTIVRTVRDTYSMVKSRATNMGAFLFLEFQGNFVDFNVHPQKKEVRFKNDFFVRKFIEDSVVDALQTRMNVLNQGGQDPFTATVYSEQLSQPMPYGRAKYNALLGRGRVVLKRDWVEPSDARAGEKIY